MSDGVDVIKELQLEDIDEKSISRTGHRAERVSAEVLFVVRPQPFRQHVRNLAVVEAVRAYEGRPFEDTPRRSCQGLQQGLSRIATCRLRGHPRQ